MKVLARSSFGFSTKRSTRRTSGSTADHVFKDGKAFAALCAQAGVAAAAGEIVTFGVTPDHPATGYGYIHPGEPLAGEHRHDGPGVAHRRPRRRSADGRGAVAPFRLEQDRRLGPHLLQLLGDAEAIVEIGDDDGRLENRPIGDDVDDRLEGRPVADQRNELLGQTLAQFRPDPHPRAAAHNHRLDLAD